MAACPAWPDLQGMRYRTASACTAVPHRMGSSYSLLSFKDSCTPFLGTPYRDEASRLISPWPAVYHLDLSVLLPLTAHSTGRAASAKGLQGSSSTAGGRCSGSGPCILKHRTRTVLSPAVFWGKTILPDWGPACLFAWDTSAHRHTSEDEQISSPTAHHPQPPANSSWCRCAAWLPEGQQGECCPHASPYLAPVLGQSRFQLQGQLQEPVLHLDKKVVTDRLGLSHSTATRPEQHSARWGMLKGHQLEWMRTITRPHGWSTPGEISPGEA